MGTFFRLVVVLIGVWIILRMVRRYLAGPSRSPEATASPPPADMLRCEYCGIFVPRADAVRSGEKQYCCSAHAEASQKD